MFILPYKQVWTVNNYYLCETMFLDLIIALSKMYKKES